MRTIVMAFALYLLPMLAMAQTVQPATPDAASTQAVPADPVGLRPGVDYEEMPIPITPYAGHADKIEVAEVFSYGCVHCAHFQPYVSKWKPSLAKDVDFEYVPAVFGGMWDSFARAYFAAEQMGVLKTTHDAVFKAIHEDHALAGGSLENIADLYGTLGVDRNKFFAAMNASGMDAKLDKARQFALRSGISGTPTIVVAGRYRVLVPRDRGPDGMLATVDALIAHERAARAARAAKPVPAATTTP